VIEFAGFDEPIRVGRGGSADVYRAVRRSTGGFVAIKVCRDMADVPDPRATVRRELEALVSLSGHAHVVQVHDLVDHPSGPALVMEYAPGGSVGRLVERGDPICTGDVALIGVHVADALRVAHSRGIVHRDVKPHNLLIDAHGRVKLCDFGVATIHGSTHGARPRALSARYASPEDLDDDGADDDGEVGASADVYSLGATLLHLAHGAPPTIRDRVRGWACSESTDRSTRILDEIISSCLRIDPVSRPTPEQLATDLEEVLDCVGGSSRGSLVVRPSRPGGNESRMLCADETMVQHDREPTGVDRTITCRRSPTRSGPSKIRTHRRHRLQVLFSVLFLVALPFGYWCLRGRDASMGQESRDEPVPVRLGFDGWSATIRPAAVPHLSVRPVGLPNVDVVDWSTGGVGSCLVQQLGVSRLVVVDCSEPHDVQRVAVHRLPDLVGADESFDDAEVDELAAHLCGSAGGSELIDGAPVATPFVRPSSSAWSDGDRRLHCFVAVRGRRIVGDVT